MCICDTLAPILTSRVRTDRGAILLEIESAPLLSEEDPGTGLNQRRFYCEWDQSPSIFRSNCHILYRHMQYMAHTLLR